MHEHHGDFLYENIEPDEAIQLAYELEPNPEGTVSRADAARESALLVVAMREHVLEAEESIEALIEDQARQMLAHDALLRRCEKNEREVARLTGLVAVMAVKLGLSADLRPGAVGDMVG